MASIERDGSSKELEVRYTYNTTCRKYSSPAAEGGNPFLPDIDFFFVDYSSLAYI